VKTEESIISRKFLNKRAGGAALRLVPIFQGEHPFLVGPMLLLHLFFGRLIFFSPQPSIRLFTASSGTFSSVRDGPKFLFHDAIWWF